MDLPDVVRELTELRRGRGLEADDVHERVGPLLRALCGIEPGDQPVVVRRKVVLRLSRVLDRLPADLGLAASVALAIHKDATDQFLDKRIAWLADHFDRDPRTARRRIDQAFRIIAQHLTDDPDPDPQARRSSPESWQVLALRSAVRLDVDPPQLVEERRILATVDELDELVLAFSAPRDKTDPDQGRIEVSAVYGGEIMERLDVSGSHARFVLRLPQPLRLGQQHEYSVRVTSRSLATMRPYYVLTPHRPTESFSVRIKFDRAATPRKIWRLAGVPARVVDDAEAPDELLELDAVGEIAIDFHDLRQGLSYGLQWLP